MSATFSTADLEPMVVGSNVMLTLQLIAAPSEDPQVAVDWKSAGSVPTIVISKLVSVVGRLFFTVTVFVALTVPTFWAVAYVMLAGVTETGTRPVPENMMVCGLLAAPYVIVAVPDSAADVDGVNVKLIVQDA